MTFGPGPQPVPSRSTVGMRHRAEVPQSIDVDVTTHDDLPGAADYARSKIGELGRYTSQPVLHAHVKLSRHRDPAVQRAVVAQANLDLDGRLVRAQVGAKTAQEAIDLLSARVRRRLEHMEARRAEPQARDPHRMAARFRADSPAQLLSLVLQMSAVSSAVSRSRWRPAPLTRQPVKWIFSTTISTCSRR